MTSVRMLTSPGWPRPTCHPGDRLPLTWDGPLHLSTLPCPPSNSEALQKQLTLRWRHQTVTNAGRSHEAPGVPSCSPAGQGCNAELMWSSRSCFCLLSSPVVSSSKCLLRSSLALGLCLGFQMGPPQGLPSRCSLSHPSASAF